jgi:hypothetical protein
MSRNWGLTPTRVEKRKPPDWLWLYAVALAALGGLIGVYIL